MILDVCHVCRAGRPDSGRIVAMKPAGSEWSAQEQGSENTPLRVRTIDVPDKDLAWHHSGVGSLYYRDGELTRVVNPAPLATKGEK